MHLALVLLVATALAACQTDAVRRPSPSAWHPTAGTLRVRLAYPPRSLDPARAATESEIAVLRQLWEPLLRPGEGLSSVQPGAAESWQVSADGLTYTFRLRSASFADGRPVRAQDFVHAWRRIIDPRLASPVADVFAGVVKGGDQAQALDPVVDLPRIDQALAGLGLAAPDDSTFQVSLPQPAARMPWVASLVQGSPVRTDVVQRGADWAANSANLVGNGPFKVSSVDVAHKIALERQPGYWAGAPSLAGLEFAVIEDDATALSRFDAGQLELTQLATADPGSRRNKVSIPELTTFWIDFNTSRSPFDQVQVRQALAMAVDRSAVLAGIPPGRAAGVGSPIPAGLPGGEVGGRSQPFDVARAQALLQAAGAAPAQLGPLSLLVGPDTAEAAIARSVAGEIQRNLGVKVDVQTVDLPTLSERRYNGDWQMTGPVGWTADYPDALSWLELFRGVDGRNLARWRNRSYDVLVAQATVELDAGRRAQLYRQAALILLDQDPALFIYQREKLFLAAPRVHNLTTTPLDEWAGSLNSTHISLS